MATGRWLVVEDINLAPPDVLAALLPLLETGHLHLSQRAEVITAKSGFQMLCSITTAPGGAGAGAYSTSTGVEVLNLNPKL
jgi:midasin